MTGISLWLISKSHFPGGSLDTWRTTYEGSVNTNCNCDCDCLRFEVAVPFPLRIATIQEVRTISETQVAILKRVDSWITVFVRDEYLITVESGISLEQNLKVVETLLK